MSETPPNQDHWEHYAAGGPPPPGSVWEKYGAVSDAEMFRQLDQERIQLTPQERDDLNELRRNLFSGAKARGHDKHWTPELADLPICDTFKVLERRAAAASRQKP
jgi:hypothetical protein